MSPRLWVAAYDVANARRLRRVARHLEACGQRVQKSVFDAALTRDERERLERRLARTIDAAQDQVLLHPVCQHCRAGVLWQGLAPGPEQEPFWIV